MAKRKSDRQLIRENDELVEASGREYHNCGSLPWFYENGFFVD